MYDPLVLSVFAKQKCIEGCERGSKITAMADKHFTHLHLHTDFSLLDGAISVDRLVGFGKEHGFKALAISDHGNIFGAVKFFATCKKAGIKPILGMEAYLTEDAAVRTMDNKYYHMLLIVQNEIGYKNLCKLISFSFQQGFYFKPRIDYNILEQHAEGLIATTACLGGHIPKLIMQENNAAVEDRIDWMLRVFGRERFYLEVQPPDQQEQKVLNAALFELAAKRNLNVVATADCHYATPEDRDAHEVMLSIQTQDKLDNPERYSFGGARVHMRTQADMLALFPNHPEAVYASGEIADRCTFDFKTGQLFFPKFEVPAEHTSESYFAVLCQSGLEELIASDRIPIDQIDAYRDRLQLEIDLIIKMGFVGYFLVVGDFIQWSKRNGIPVGPGRGSAAGSLVAWALQITNIDPLKYNLLFERFLNPERVSMPDIDIDFCIEGRERVINYVREKYGHDKVCQIITFGTMMAKGVVKDVGRVIGLPFDDANMITGMIPETLKITLKEALEQEPRIKELIEANPKVATLFDHALRLEGLTRHASKHAAGIVISPEPIEEVLPVYVPPGSKDLVTQYAMTELESLGFLKMDLLGLKNLTLIDRCTRLINSSLSSKDNTQRAHSEFIEESKREINMRSQLIDIDKIPLDDPKAFALVCAGNTSGVFQLESNGLKDVLRRLKPEKFEDIIAVNALYRPGPLGSGMVDDYIARRHGKAAVKYLFPELEPILDETYGVIVYQEQVMKIASAIAGYSLGEADLLRRAMGKKKAEEMAKHRAIFTERATQKGFNTAKAGELFDLMAYFAGYGFNKSHSAAYALIAYQTAYLKANYPAEFMACLISLESGDADKMVFYLQEAKDMGLEILPPDINKSHIDFTVDQGLPWTHGEPNNNNEIKPKLRFGLQGIKNVGLTSLENIITERAERPFIDLLDFCSRIDLRTSNRRVIEHLIFAGAFDSLPGHRAQQHNELQKIIDRAGEIKEQKLTGQMGLFGAPAEESDNKQPEPYAFELCDKWDAKTQLEKEKEVIGFYLSAHPLDTYRHHLRWLEVKSFNILLEQSLNLPEEPMVLGCGLVKTQKVIFTKKNDRMAFVTLEDANSKAEVVIFPKLFAQVEAWLSAYNVFVIRGILDQSSPTQCKIRANELVPLDLFFSQWQIKRAQLTLPPQFGNNLLQELKNKLQPGKIPVSLVVTEQSKQIHIAAKHAVSLDAQILRDIEQQSIGVKLII